VVPSQAPSDLYVVRKWKGEGKKHPKHAGKTREAEGRKEKST